jgi:hypothetical protein
MPDDGYINPDKKPYSGKYNWVPSYIPTAGSTAGLGWLDLVHERGSYRNDYFISSSVSTNYTLIPSYNSGTGVSYFGNPEWPVNIAFRRKQNPTPLVPPVPNKIFWVKSNSYWWQADFNTIATNLSAITFEYSLLVNINDPNLLTILNGSAVYGAADDYNNLLAYQTGASNNVSIDWSKYIFGKIKLYQSTDTEDTAASFPASVLNASATTTDRTTYTSSVNWNQEDNIQVYRALPDEDFIAISPDEYTANYLNNTIKFKTQQPENTVVNITINTTPILATGYYNGNSDSDSTTKTITVHFDYGSSDFRDISKLRIQAFYTDGPVIKFSLKKVMLFRVLSNPRVNISNTQLPCRILAYAFNVNCGKTIPGLSDYYPNDNNNPTFYVKVFHPEDTIKSRGFAHAIDLRFFVPSFPIYSFNGLTLGGSISKDDYWVVFVGPTLGKKTVIYYLTGVPISGSSINGRLVRINNINLNTNSSILIQKINSTTEPTSTSAWQDIYFLENTSNISMVDGDTFVSPWLYYDSSGNVNSWYRIGQTDLNTAVTEFSSSFKGQIYSEKSALALEATGVSSAGIVQLVRSVSLLGDTDPLNLDPLAYFTVDLTDDLLGSSILFRKGQWKFNFKARSNDSSNQTNTHIFLRFWFHPGEEVINYNNPHQYRNSNTEIIFEKYDTDPTNISDPKPSIKLSIGSPSSLENLVVSPPLTQDLNSYEILRFADGLIGESVNNIYQSIFASPTTKVVVGVYTFSYPQNATSANNFAQNLNPPTIELELDPVTTRLETSILQNTPDSLSASRYYLFNRTNYVHFNTDASNSLRITRNYYEGGVIGIGSSYIPYNNKFTLIDSNINPTGDSRVGLLSLESGPGNYSPPEPLLCLEYPSWSLFDDKSVSYYAEFSTNSSTFQDGRVNASTWNVSFQLDYNLDSLRIPATYKLMAFFVDRYGIVTERVFTSPYLTPNHASNANLAYLSYAATINQPYFITGTDTQLIFRIIAYPRSSNNQILTDAEFANIRTALNGNPIGTRIKNFYLTVTSATPGTSGLTKLNIVDAGGFTGSTRFYEDLDLVPSSSLDSQQFWFYADSETLKAQLIANGKEFMIMGALYSPTWFVKLPQGIEVSVIGGTAFNSTFPAALKIRTVLDDSVTIATEDLVKATEDGLENSTHIVVNGVQETGSDVTSVINYIKLNDPMNTPMYKGLVAGQSSGNRKILSGEDPIIFNMSVDDRGFSGDILALASESQDTNGSKINLSLNSDGGVLDYWIGPNYNLADDNFADFIRQIAYKMTKPDIKFWPIDKNIYVLGIVSPGALMMRRLNPFDSSIDGTLTQGYNFLIDGPTDIANTIQYIDEYIEYSENLSNSIVLETRPSISIDNNGIITFAYVLEGTPNQITGKIYTSGGIEKTTSFAIVDMGFSTTASNETAVYCPVLCHFAPLNITYCAFWCAGKIFVARILFQDFYDQYLVNTIYLVAGNRDFTATDNPAHPYLRTLQSSGYLVVDQDGSVESDIHRQSVGFFVSKNPDHDSEMFVYYKINNDNESDIMVRKLFNSGSVSERLKVS